jgi:hypothetical protein
VKPVKKFESRDVAVTRIWAVLSLEPVAGKVAGNPKAVRKKVTWGRKQPKASKAGATVRDEVVKMLSRAGGASVPELMQAFKWQAHSVRGFVCPCFEAWLEDRVVEGRRREGLPHQVTSRSVPGQVRKVPGRVAVGDRVLQPTRLSFPVGQVRQELCPPPPS